MLTKLTLCVFGIASNSLTKFCANHEQFFTGFKTFVKLKVKQF